MGGLGGLGGLYHYRQVKKKTKKNIHHDYIFFYRLKKNNPQPSQVSPTLPTTL